MKKTKRSFSALSVIISLLLIITSLPLTALSANAASNYGNFTYTVSNGEITITDCNETVSGDVIIPNTISGYKVKYIGSWAFANCNGIKSISIGSNVVSIGYRAFNDCKGLKEVNIPDSVTSIDSYAFWGDSAIKSVSIGTGLTKISDDCFNSCTALEQVTIGKNVTEIGAAAFKNCTALTTITFGESLTKIGDSAFSGCKSLTSLKIPDTVVTVGSCAFYGCENVKEVKIGKSVTSIGYRAFDDCKTLNKIYLPESLIEISGNAFNSCVSLKNVYYESSKDDWNSVNIGGYNDPLKNATMHYNYKYTTSTCEEKGHSYGSWITTKTATCTTPGTKTRTCSNCGWKETQTIAAKGHSYTTTVVAPTTTSKGYTLHKCSACGYSYKDNYTDQLKPTNPNSPQIVIDNKTASVGGQVTVNVVMKNNPGISGWAVNVSYDSSALELVKCGNSAYGDITTSSQITKNPYRIQWYSLNDVKTNGNLFTLTFNVKQSAKEGVYPIKLTYNADEICNQNDKNVNFDVVNGSIKVTKHLPGDINNDGKVNLRDVIRLNQYVAGWNVSVNSGAADVNGDGKVNLRDVIRLNQYVAGWSVTIN